MIKQSFFFNVKKELSPLQVYTDYYFYNFLFWKMFMLKIYMSLKNAAVFIKNFNNAYMYMYIGKNFWFEPNKLAKSYIFNNIQVQA